MTSTTKPHTIFFDVGGTLLKATPSVGVVYAEVAARYGIEADPAEIETRARHAFGQMQIEARERGGMPHAVSLDSAWHWWREIVRRSFGRAAGHPRFHAFYDAVFKEFARPERYELFPEVESLLADLAAAGHRLGVISNWDPRLRPILEGLDLARRFKTIIISGEVGVEKPDRRIYDLARAAALEDQPHSADARFMQIGDSMIDDYDGAMAAGFEGRLVDRSQGLDLRAALADVLKA